jgi:hypothetical protein
LYCEDGNYFSDSDDEYLNIALSNGFHADAVLGPLTLQLLLAPNFSKENAAELTATPIDGMYEAAGVPSPGVTADGHFFRLGYRGIAGTRSVQTFTISNVNWTTFGAYFDFTAAENPGVSLGYTSPLPVNAALMILSESILYVMTGRLNALYQPMLISGFPLVYWFPRVWKMYWSVVVVFQLRRTRLILPVVLILPLLPVKLRGPLALFL